MKRVIIGGGIIVLLMMGAAGGCGWMGLSWARGVLDNQPEQVKWSWPWVKICTGNLPITKKIEQMTNNKKYVVLLQNNTELRPSGGFMGSYVRLKFGQGAIQEMKVEDIYQPDGQLTGHVEPPYPIQEAFRTGYWKLRDANWDVDFASAAAATTWFMDEGGEKGIDGVAAVNLDLIKKWIGVLDGVKTETYDETVTEKNLYQLAQRQAEENFHPGSTQKRDFLGAVGTALMEKTKAAGAVKMFKLISLFREELDKGQMLVWFKDPGLQAEADNLGWTGGLGNYKDDYFYLVEANLGSNKANCCVERQVTADLNTTSSVITTEKVTIDWKNTNQFVSPKPPLFWGGDYYAYVRLVIPKGSQVESVGVKDGDGNRKLEAAKPADFMLPNSTRQERSINMYADSVRDKFRIVGWWMRVPAQRNATAELEYEMPPVNVNRYEVKVRRQSGIESFKYKLLINGKITTDEQIVKDTVITSDR